MVVYDFDFVDVFAFPTKAEAPLVIDANAVLTSYKLSKYNAVLSQRFVAVVRAFSAAAGASFHPADFPAAFSSSAVRLNVLRSFSRVSCPDFWHDPCRVRHPSALLARIQLRPHRLRG